MARVDFWKFNSLAFIQKSGCTKCPKCPLLIRIECIWIKKEEYIWINGRMSSMEDD